MLMQSLQAMSAQSSMGAYQQQNSLALIQQMQLQQLGMLAPALTGGYAHVKQEMLSVKQEGLSVKKELGAVKQEYVTVTSVLPPASGNPDVMTEADYAAFGLDGGVQVTRLPRVHRKTAPPERPPPNVDEDSDAEGVPHRLPPGFGAIPEELVEQRQRERDEERMRAIKSTQPCRFGLACKKRDCPNMHPEGRNIDTTMNPCAFGKRCKRHNCFYDHPEGRHLDDDPTKGVCKLGKRCKRADCLYMHPEGRDVPVGTVQLCFFCHEMGHIAQECPRNPSSWAFNRGADRERQLMAALTDGS